MSIDRKPKFLLLTDSNANPRSFPASMVVHVEETYPYLLRKEFPDSVFYQLSFGNLKTEDLISQALAYLTHWHPDFIIVHSGLADCRPEAFTEAEKAIIGRLPGRFLGRLKKHLYNPGLIRRRQLYRVSKQSFQKTIKKFKLVFSKSKIFWVEICVSPNYEIERPGVGRRISEYNKIIENTYGEDFIRFQDRIVEVGGFNVDNVHWLVSAHKALLDILLGKLKDSLPADIPKAATSKY
jgi:hypothetical protein